MIDFPDALQRISDAYVASSEGSIQTPDFMHLEFPAANGDCHIKAGHSKGSDTFVVKIASGFYDNPKKGHEIGLALAPQSGIELMTAYGATYNKSDERLRFSEEVVNKALADANRSLTLHARDPKYDLNLDGQRVHYGTAGAAVHLANIETGEYEESTLEHLFMAAKIVDQLDNVHFFQRCLIARDLTDNRELDINTLYA